MNFKCFLFGIAMITFFGCSNRQTDLQFEQQVFYQVVPGIIDSEFPDTSRGGMVQKTVDGSSVWVREASVNAIIGILDSVYGFNQAFYEKYINLHFSNDDFKLDELNSQESYKLDILKIQKRRTYNMKYLSEIPDSKKTLEKRKKVLSNGANRFFQNKI